MPKHYFAPLMLVGALVLPVQPATARANAAQCSAARVALAPDRLAAARSVLNASIARKFAPGAVMMISHRGRVVLTETLGMSDAERGKPMTPDAVFRLYSMTKPVTTAAAMQLVEAGKLGLDDPVAKYIPAFATTPVFISGDSPANLKTEPQVRPLTVRDLMRHTAGMTYKAEGPTVVQRLYALRGVDTGSGADIAPLDGSPRVASSAELADRIATVPLLHQPGSRYSYGNAVDVLGRVVEVASGERLSAYAQRRIFGPLKMTDTGFVVREGQRDRFTAAYGAPSVLPPNSTLMARIDPLTTAAGPMRLVDDPARSPYLAVRSIDYGGAGLVGTARDYLRFAEAMRTGSLDGVRLLSRTSLDMMRMNQLPDGARTPELADAGLGFGLGFAVRDAKGTLDLNFPRCGYFWAGAASTYFWIDPENQVSGVLMTQVFGGDIRSVWLKILDALYGPAVGKPAR